MSRDLPEFPNLEHLKKQAKVMLRDLRQKQPSAKLADAQLAIARAYGFASWTRLKEHIESLPSAGAHGGGITGPPLMTSVATGGGGQFARYTEKVRRAIFYARAWARKRESAKIEPEHLMLALLDADPKLLDDLFGEHASREMEFRIRRELDGRTTTPEKLTDLPIPLSTDCRRILDSAAEQADRLRHEHISTGHFWLSFMHDEGSPVNAILAGILAEKGMQVEKAEAEIIRELNADELAH